MREQEPVALAVTTSSSPEPPLVREAQQAASDWGLPFIPRPRNAPLKSLVPAQARALLVFERERVTLLDGEGQLPYHAGMAHLRLQRLASGEGDTLVRLAGLGPGDSVLDCTLGLGQDALVAARAVGPGGRVVGVEHSLPLVALLQAGLRRTGPLPDSCAVEVQHAEALAFLRTLAPGSVDVVLFDPMFEAPKKSQPGFALLRRHADHTPLSPEALAEARRVARRRVVVKTGRYSRALQQVGLVPHLTSRYADLAWGVIDVEEARASRG